MTPPRRAGNGANGAGDPDPRELPDGPIRHPPGAPIPTESRSPMTLGRGRRDGAPCAPRLRTRLISKAFSAGSLNAQSAVAGGRAWARLTPPGDRRRSVGAVGKSGTERI